MCGAWNTSHTPSDARTTSSMAPPPVLRDAAMTDTASVTSCVTLYQGLADDARHVKGC
jgi:hypothetical protein